MTTRKYDKKTKGILVMVVLAVLCLPILLWSQRRRLDAELESIRVNVPASMMHSVNVSVTEKPRGFYSTGLLGRFYEINTKKVFEVFPLGVEIFYEPMHLAGLDESTLTLFFIDAESGHIRPIDDSKVDMQHHSVYGAIPGPGTVMVLGLPSNPKARNILMDTSRLIHAGVGSRRLEARIQETCELILCAGMEWIADDPILADQYLGGFDPDDLGVATGPEGYSPGSTFPSLPPIGASQPSLSLGCEECEALELGVYEETAGTIEYIEDIFPESEIILPETRSPCDKEYYSP